MHETTSKWLCRVAFLVLAVVPLVWLLTLGLVRVLPTHRAAWETQLEQQLGVEVALAGISHPRPQVVQLEGLALTDPETGQSLAAAESLRATRLAGGWQIETAELRLEQPGLARLSQHLHQRLLLAEGPPAPILLLADRVDLVEVAHYESLYGCQARLDTVATGPRAVLQFHTAADETEPATLRIARNRQLAPPATGIEITSGPAGLPTSLAAPWLPPAATPAEARFHGTLTCQTGGEPLRFLRLAQRP